MRQSYKGMIHLNGNLLCAIDTETTGHEPGTHDIIELAILPLNANFEPHQDVMPLHMFLQPKRPENIDPEAMSVHKHQLSEIMLKGLDPWRAAELLEEWFDSLKLGFNKRLAPLAQNWAFDRGFIMEWLSPKTFNYIFDPRYRDTMVAALFENDIADSRSDKYPYPKVNLRYLATTLKVSYEKVHQALGDCLATAEVYKRIVQAHY